MLNSAGIGSGLDVNSIVAQLMQLESRNLSSITSKQNDVNAKLSAIGEVENLLDTFQSAADALAEVDQLNLYTASVADETQFTVTVDENAASIGNHSIQINQLAQAHKLSSNAFNAKDIDTGANGTLEISVNGTNFQIVVDSNNNTLEGIRDSINNAVDNTTVQASILAANNATTGDPEFHLVLTSETTGEDNQIILSDVSGNVASTLNVTNEINAARNAELTIDGFSVSRASNSMSDVIEGVQLDLLQSGNPATDLNISNDVNGRNDKIAETVQEFVDAYNNVIGSIDTLAANTGERDSSLSLLKSSMRAILESPTQNTGIYSILADLGVTTDSVERLTSLNGNEFVSSGKLSFDSSVLKTVLAEDYDSAIQLLVDDNEGFAKRFSDMADDVLTTGGLIDIRKDTLNDQDRFLGDRILREEARLEDVEASLFAQFTSLDTIVAEFQATSNFLTQQLANLPRINSGSNN